MVALPLFSTSSVRYWWPTGQEVLAAIVSGDLENKTETELVGLLTTLTQIATGCKQYNSYLSIQKEGDYKIIKDTLSSWVWKFMLGTIILLIGA